ncbi:hypothetical protein GCM10011395_14020 [Sphingomonas psychrolutea]|uniref:Uncharacterized protein n=1 Tax=Sphingomonas psychrolutea TaxID=1259676 RepID=A0ABQ1GJD5_9SPHN|nr:hypothetical protein GCM10011395_14020 [Sphingomonas psychrolutea]
MRVERYGEGAADESTAENDYVCCFHKAPLTVGGGPAKRAFRLTDAPLRAMIPQHR